MRCPLCGTEFSESDPASCKSCPLGSKSCDLICCPNCGYEWPAESPTVMKIKKFFTNLGKKVEKEN